MVKLAKPGDLSVFYYSGHGSRRSAVPDTNSTNFIEGVSLVDLRMIFLIFMFVIFFGFYVFL
jgi:hypothetical protein